MFLNPIKTKDATAMFAFSILLVVVASYYYSLDPNGSTLAIVYGGSVCLGYYFAYFTANVAIRPASSSGNSQPDQRKNESWLVAASALTIMGLGTWQIVDLMNIETLENHGMFWPTLGNLIMGLALAVLIGELYDWAKNK